MKNRILAVDFGSKKIGLAISDAQKKFALPLKTILAKNSLEASAQALVLAIKHYLPEIEKIVVGLPLLLNGQESKMARVIKNFAFCLAQQTNIEVVLQEETLTSVEAEEKLKLADLSVKKHKDSVAAMAILQDYLNLL